MIINLSQSHEEMLYAVMKLAKPKLPITEAVANEKLQALVIMMAIRELYKAIYKNKYNPDDLRVGDWSALYNEAIEEELELVRAKGIPE